MSSSNALAIITPMDVTIDDYNVSSALRELADEVNYIQLHLHKETTVGKLPTTNDNMYGIKSFMLREGIDENKVCTLISDRAPKQTVSENKKSIPRFYHRWCGVEYILKGFSVRILSCNNLDRFGILTDDGWKYFRSYGNVLKHINISINGNPYIVK